MAVLQKFFSYVLLPVKPSLDIKARHIKSQSSTSMSTSGSGAVAKFIFSSDTPLPLVVPALALLLGGDFHGVQEPSDHHRA